VVLEPDVILRGRTRIGEVTVIGAGSQVIATTVGPRARINTRLAAPETANPPIRKLFKTLLSAARPESKALLSLATRSGRVGRTLHSTRSDSSPYGLFSPDQRP
jgi:hypothetical protein